MSVKVGGVCLTPGQGLCLTFCRPRRQILSKYSPELASETLEWIAQITGESINTAGDTANFWETLKDGILLCK